MSKIVIMDGNHDGDNKNKDGHNDDDDNPDLTHVLQVLLEVEILGEGFLQHALHTRHLAEEFDFIKSDSCICSSVRIVFLAAHFSVLTSLAC